MNPETYRTHIVFELFEQFRQVLKAENFSEITEIEDFVYLETAHNYI